MNPTSVWQGTQRLIKWKLEKKYFFSDKSKFDHFGSDCRHYVRWTKSKIYGLRYVILTVKQGGGHVMLCGQFSGKCVDRSVAISQRQDEKCKV